MTASSPIFKGKLSALDTRFDVISQAMDDRTDDEKDKSSPNYIYKSRYSPVYSYISNNAYVQDFHNDYPRMPINEEFLKTMIENGIPPRLSEHFCNLFVRDPLVVFDKKIQIEDKYDFSHFESFNSTNWNSLRFKPPRVEDNDSCFKVEVRPCELQLTPFENSAIMGFTILYSKIILYNNINFVIPISMVDENFERAKVADCMETQKFWWRINSIEKDYKLNDIFCHKWITNHDEIPKSYFNKEEDLQNIKQLTMKEIFFGCEQYNYPGILKLMYEFVDSKVDDNNDKETLVKYLRFIEQRVKGKTPFYNNFR